MKKLVYLIIVILALGLIVSGCLPVVPTLEEKGSNNNNGNNDLKPPSGTHFNLNLIGKKDEWPGGGNNNNNNFNNPDRHTIFVPQYIGDFGINVGTEEDPEWVPGITIWMTQGGDDFAVIDGNACIDGEAAFRLPSGKKYDVYVVAKGKPGGKTDISGWGWVYNEGVNEYYFQVGEKVFVGGHSGKPKWKVATGLFYVGDDWIFDYLAGLGADDTAYFWQVDNQGNKLVQVRFYEKPPK